MPMHPFRHRFCAALFALVAAASASAASFTGTVTRVRDGDTVQVVTDRGQKIEVRLEGIDAPEKGYKGRPSERYAEQSRRALTQIALNQRVHVEGARPDRYGRQVGVLWVQTEDGELDAGLLQVQLGMARVVPKYLEGLPEHLRASYRYAEAIAKSRGRGIWSRYKTSSTAAHARKR